jgi:putative tryptophan/tyrosine transport system substrate-binding protein
VRVFGLICGLVVATAWADSERTGQVVVVKSADLLSYKQVEAGFAAELAVRVETLVLAPGTDAARAMRALAKEKPALVLSLGPVAAVAAKAELGSIPSIFAMVPSFQKYDLEGPATTGIALTSDLSVELSGLSALMPKAKRVGVVCDTRFSARFIEEATTAAKGRGLQLVPLDVDSPERISQVLAQAVGRIDALVVIADKTVGTAPVVSQLIDWAIAQKVPCVALASAQVRQGALLAVSPSPLAIGLQAGRLANRILQEKLDPGAIVVATPEAELHVNLATAKKLGLGVDFVGALMTFAARQGLAVRAGE